jgi:hypothetical protein
MSLRRFGLALNCQGCAKGVTLLAVRAAHHAVTDRGGYFCKASRHANSVVWLPKLLAGDQENDGSALQTVAE